jgi:hypothetical protein
VTHPGADAIVRFRTELKMPGASVRALAGLAGVTRVAPDPNPFPRFKLWRLTWRR